MIYTITLNPSIDYVIHINQLHLGELNKMENEMKFPGGKGINVSRLLHELKYDTTALGFLGGFTGDFIVGELNNKGIRAKFTPIHGETRINIKLKSETETEINGLGPEILPHEADHLLCQLGDLTRQDMIILSGSTPPSLNNDYLQQLIEQIASSGASFVTDTTGNALKSVLPYRPLLVKPNMEELGGLFGVTLSSLNEVVYYGKKLLDLGTQYAIVSMAGDGALLFTEEGIYQGSTPAGHVKNSVGAGDSMIAAFAGKWKETGDVMEAFRMGLASGSATAFSDDLAKAEDIYPLLNKIDITRIEGKKKHED
ncbi:fructose-1-phosphate kinase [Lentibacillus halodurans]|uniref:Tagatose-6-phosphate kinase n=1 Tax=Lentibacillus halodurans TaxID=237679 RepID=A0A1I0YEF1_9BACI|nr:1-phosphofructokinase [Lentibacillus halodurans]SFB11167.1 fructose-1-phosphate kinase [Lentibacillus halodurans]